MIKIGELFRKLCSLRSCFNILPPGALTPQGIGGAMKRDVSKHWCTLQWCVGRGWFIAHENWTLWNTCFEAFQEFLENLVLGSNIRFSAQMSNNAKKIHWNTQKTTTKHVLRLFEKFLKIRFSAQKCGSQHRFRTMLKYIETLRKHQLSMFWGFLRNFWKSGSRLKNPILGPDIKQC